MGKDKTKDETKENLDVKDWSNNSGDEKEDTLMKEGPLSSEIKSLQDDLGRKKNEYEELYDKYLRAAADFDNYKKRVAKEKAEIISYGNEELIKEFLNVLDNLERALEHSEASGETKSIFEGINLVHKQFLSCLEKFGVMPISLSKGDKFDPRFHQAIEYIKSSEITPGLIISEMLKGYNLRGRLLRPSLVVVSKEVETPLANQKASVEIGNDHEMGNSDSEEVSDLIDENSDNN